MSEQAEGRPRRRLIRDSSRYLVAKLRAALEEPVDPVTQAMDRWRAGERALERSATDVAAVLNACLAEASAPCAAKDTDLLLDEVDRLPTLPADPAALKGALLAVIAAAARTFARGRTLWATTRAAGGEPSVTFRTDHASADEREEVAALLEVADTDLAVARTIAAAHGGGLELREAGAGAAIAVTLPAE